MRRAVVVLAILLSACASVGPQVHDVSGVSDRLFCGRSIPGGGAVTDSDLEAFIAEEVTPRFPEGFTMWTATGSWKGEEETTLVLEFIHPYGRRFDDQVREIAEAYRKRFRQESVMRVTLPALMEFVNE